MRYSGRLTILSRQQTQAHAHHSTTKSHLRTSLLHLRRTITCPRSCRSLAELVGVSGNALGTQRTMIIASRTSRNTCLNRYSHRHWKAFRDTTSANGVSGGPMREGHGHGQQCGKRICSSRFTLNLGFIQATGSISISYKVPSYSQDTHPEGSILIQQASLFASSILP
jgi:hypothetical protein